MIFGLAAVETGHNTGTYELYAYSGNSSTNTDNETDYSADHAIKIEDIEDGCAFVKHVKAVVDKENGEIELTVGETTKTLSFENVGTEVDSMKVAIQRGATMYLDNIAIRDYTKTVNPTATYEQIGDYTSETETDNKASAFKLNVTAGTNAIKSVGAKVNDKMSENTINTTINSGSTVVFAIAVNAAAEDVESIKAVIDGTTDIDATPVTVTTIE